MKQITSYSHAGLPQDPRAELTRQRGGAVGSELDTPGGPASLPRSISAHYPHFGPEPLTTDELRKEADRRLEQALADSGAPDPRILLRKHMLTLRSRDRRAYARALEAFEGRLLPSVARGDSDPLSEWLAYGQFLAGLIAPGRTVQIDATGLARDFAPPAVPIDLVLHVPESGREEVLLLAVPDAPSAAQRATLDLLVRGRQE